MGKNTIGDFAMGVANSAANAALGIGLGSINDNRNYKMQKKLQKLQIQGQKEMADYNYLKQLDMWDATGYGAQRKQMEEAGLNAGLMYGMGGGGGQTVGSQGGNVSGGNGPSTGGEAQAMAQMGIQYQLLKAQKENIEADTANKQADTSNKPLQGANIEADTLLKKGAAKLQEIETEFQGRSLDERVQKIYHESEKILEEMTAIARKNSWTLANQNLVNQQWEAESIKATLEVGLAEAEIKAKEAGAKKDLESIALMRKQIDKLANEISNANKYYDLDKAMQDYNTTINPWVKEGLGVIRNAVEGYLRPKK